MTRPDSQPFDEILTVDEVADYLRVSRATVCRWCGAGKLPAFKIGKSWRVRRSVLEGYTQHIQASEVVITQEAKENV
jgi:excisionase family DNA binding protein